MSRTRDGVSNEKNPGEVVIQIGCRRVIRDTHSCVGSSAGSGDGRRSRKSESALISAELKRSQLQKVLEMQAVRDEQDRERQLLSDKNKSDPETLGISLDPMCQSVNP
ncbi:hypothetical protein T265_08578 [Opisthorchis viverrini]|uniref:Uncharacterized protein n=1 Tax=Opisthorchis viverrini TaxID=6198 RepID=A0A074Z8X7_OPIVI|nr:hypothetical protein T265_08578 [Opisthorchis viverrini]KER23588.1 hypothetical protein T265_08578 [Opisthorchis viverrini]